MRSLSVGGGVGIRCLLARSRGVQEVGATGMPLVPIHASTEDTGTGGIAAEHVCRPVHSQEHTAGTNGEDQPCCPQLDPPRLARIVQAEQVGQEAVDGHGGHAVAAGKAVICQGPQPYPQVWSLAVDKALQQEIQRLREYCDAEQGLELPGGVPGDEEPALTRMASSTTGADPRAVTPTISGVRRAGAVVCNGSSIQRRKIIL